MAIAAVSLLFSGVVAGVGASPAAAAAGAPVELRTAGKPCMREAPGPYLSPDLLNAARAVVLQARYPGETTVAEVESDFEVWDVADDQNRQQWRRGANEETGDLYVQLEDDAKQLHGVTYAWRVRVLDGEEVSPWSETCYFTLDRVGGDAPAVASEQYPAGSFNRGGIGVPGTFTLTAATDDVVAYEYRFSASEISGDAEWKTADAPSVGAPVTVTFTPVAANYHGLNVYAVDRAGNRSELAGYDFWVRDTRPTVFSADYPELWGESTCCANLDFNVGVAGEFQFNGTDDVEKLAWRIDQGGPSGTADVNDDGDAVVRIAPTRAGVQTLYVRGVTAGGTAYPERSYRFLVDDGPLVTGDVDRDVVIGSTASFRAAPRVAGVTAYVYWLFYRSDDGEPRKVTVPAKADGTADIAWPVSDIDQQGLYVQSRTADGTLSVARRINSGVNGAEPSVTRTGGGEPGSVATFVARTAMTNVADYTVQFNGDAATKRTLTPAADGSATFEFTPTKTGYQYLHIWATNTAGIRTDTGSASWNVANGPKVTSTDFPVTGAGRVAAGTFTFTPRLPVATSYQYEINFGAVGTLPAQADGSATLTWTPPASGSYTMDVRSYNGSASSQLTTYRFRVAPADVRITSVSPSSVLTGAVRTITLQGTNLHPKDVLQVTPAGGTPLTATVTSATGTTLTADVDLTGAPAGTASVTLQPYGAEQPVVSVPSAFTVSPPPSLQATKRPTISGTVAVGGVVKVAPGTWTPVATGYRYQWAANGVAIKGATGTALTVPPAAVGKRLTVTVTATRTGHPSGTAASAATAAVAKGKAPKATQKPKFTGTPKAGRKLTAAVGTWSPKVDAYRYEWRLNGKLVKGATARTLKLKAAWRNKRITVTVITKKAGYADGRATSASVKVR
ncbi:hypothetical protein [Paractinoplanes rishiriensis]|uniref:hypothetical protein n=1 Tax=Paractinoplanes rishiriensis TaxID=1050105 RepID=UPI001943F62D|nr:hypothetical protein [Actinoplanes rishiriensis]